MTGLQEGYQYSLSTEEKNNKSIIFVKFTDSAVQSIERFLNSQDDSSSKPSIQFQNNSGIISLPQNGNKQNYGFTLSNIEVDGLQSSFQCIQHIDDSSLESLGFIFMKMQIHATEDSYEKTKCKMTAADQEQKNLCTKELRQTVSRLSNKTSVKRPGLVYVNEKTQPGTGTVKLESTKLIAKCKVTSPATLIQQPIRERIIHILAAKSYKKAELLLRLKREGVSDKDKDQVNTILLEVAKLKGNICMLENHIWNEVQDDWEFCSQEELQLIKKKKQQYCKPKNVNGVGGLSKPCVKQKDVSAVPETPVKLFSKRPKLSVHSALNGNKISQNGFCVPNNNLTNGTTTGSTENLPNYHAANGNFDDFYLLSKEIPSLFNQKKDLPVDKNNYFESNGTVQVSEIQSTVGSIPSSQTSFLLQEHKNEIMNGHIEEKMCVEIVNTQHESRTSNLFASNAMSVCKQSENGNGSQIQVKQPNSRSKANFNGGISSESLSVLAKIKSYKQLLIDDSPPRTHKKGKQSEDSAAANTPLTQSALEFDFSEIQLKYPKLISVEQRSQYLQDFNAEYEEYMKLQSQMKEISMSFSALFDRLHACAEGSVEFKKIKVEIGKKYRKTLKNNCYVSSRKKFEYLKAKLSHIKEVIMEYDTRETAD